MNDKQGSQEYKTYRVEEPPIEQEFLLGDNHCGKII